MTSFFGFCRTNFNVFDNISKGHESSILYDSNGIEPHAHKPTPLIIFAHHRTTHQLAFRIGLGSDGLVMFSLALVRVLVWNVSITISARILLILQSEPDRNSPT